MLTSLEENLCHRTDSPTELAILYQRQRQPISLIPTSFDIEGVISSIHILDNIIVIIHEITARPVTVRVLPITIHLVGTLERFTTPSFH